MAYAYTRTNVKISDNSVKEISTLSYIIETQEEMEFYAKELVVYASSNPLPTIKGFSRSWVTYPPDWYECIHVVVKIS